ncbi:VCBS repeat-containing protein, partial [bacterium]|nr:VCBS repeat-containing protein [bacterium]
MSKVIRFSAVLIFSIVPSVLAQTTFTKITMGAIVNDVASSRPCAWIDFNKDGYLDLFVANAAGENNFLYQNNGTTEGTGLVTFTAVTTDGIVADGGDSRGSSWADYDNDGNLDLFVANALGENNFLYRNDGVRGGAGLVSFTPITERRIVT